MNNDETHLNKSSDHFDFSMQNMNQSLNDSDDNCIELLDMISMDDNSSTILSTQSNINSGNVLLDVGESKEHDRFYQEIMSALDKKDFQRIATLALSQSQGGQQMGAILNETMLAIEKTSNKAMDSNILEKLTNMFHSQPKNNASVLRATVAPIRNESVVSSSSPNIANYCPVPNNPSSKSSSHLSRVSTSQEFCEYDLQALFSSETKPQGSRSLPATPPVSQVPSRPLSSSCLPPKNGDAWRLDIDQSCYQTPPGINAHMPIMFNNPPSSVMLQSGGYSQVAHNNQYQPSFITNNGIVCLLTPSLSGEVPQSLYPNMSQNPFMMSQNVIMPISNNNTNNNSSQSLSSTCAMNTFAVSDTPKARVASSANLPRLLPKSNIRSIAPKTQYSSQQFVNQVPQTFKRPTVNKRNNVKPKSSGSKNTRPTKANDNINMAWEIAIQSNDDQAGESFVSQLEAQNDYAMIQNRPLEEDSYDANLDLDNIFEGFSQIQYCTLTAIDNELGNHFEEEVISFCNLQTFTTTPLIRASKSSTPMLHKALVMVSKPTTLDNDDLTWPQASNNSRMVQFLCAHLGRHSDLLSPFLKCLLPQSSESHQDISTGPLSVSTEQEDLMIEEDLLADISPVKRDPTHLANLDRLLESCQPPSSDVSTCSSSNLGHARMAYQSTEDCYTLDNIIRGHLVVWIKRDKHKNKWVLNNKVIPSIRSIEVPYVTEKKSPTFLRKKSNYRDNKLLRRPLIKSITKNDKYRLNMDRLLNENKIKLEEKLSAKNEILTNTPSTGLLKIRIQLPKNNVKEPVLKPVTIKLENIRSAKTVVSTTSHDCDIKTKVNLEPTLPQKLKLDLSKTLPDNVAFNDQLKPLVVKVDPVVDFNDPLSVKIESLTDYLSKRPISPKKSQTRKSRKKKSRSHLKQLPCLSKQIIKSGCNTKRIFCTRKEDRRSSVLHTPQVTNHSPIKTRHSPTKKKRNKIVTENPPLIMKLCSKKSEVIVTEIEETEPEQEQEEEQIMQTSDSIKLLIKRNGQCSYKSQISSVLTAAISDNVSEEETYQYNSEVNLAPPSQLRSRPQQAVLQFSPTHSSSDSDEVGVAHNEISSLLQRQEQREPLSNSVATSSSIITKTTFPSLPVPYLIGCDPTVFMDPHEVELVVVKNSRYKKISQRESADYSNPTTTSTSVNIFAPETAITNNNEIFVPGCFIEQEKPIITWNRSSPSMPVLAPQEPFASAVDVSKSSISTHPCGYSQSTQQSQPFSDPPDHTQQSPLCMATTNTHNSQYSSSSQIDLMPSDPVKSPYRHSSYHYQPTYNSSCYLGESSNQAMIPPLASVSSSKSQMQSPPVPLQTNVSSACSSHFPDYSYFHNPSQQTLQSLVSVENSLFPVPSSNYQSISEPQPSKSSTKRSSSSRNNQSCEQLSSSSKKRKDSSSLSSLPNYSNNSDLYTAATHYPNLDYYSSGISNIFSNMEQMKLYEQYAREYSLQFGNFCPPNIPWSNAMAEYCKQAQVLNPQASSTSPNIIPGGLPSVNPLSNLQATDYTNPYSAYTMTQPYSSMYFGAPK